MKRILLLLVCLISLSNLYGQNYPFKIYSSYNNLDKEVFQNFNDTTYIVNFWATWCAPCVKELPYFEEITQEMKGDKVKVFLVSLDFPKHYERKLIPFLDKHNLQSEVVVLDDVKTNEWIDKVDPTWSGAIPATVIYKGNQRLFYEREFSSYAELKSILETFK